MNHKKKNIWLFFKLRCWVCLESSDTPICSVCLTNLPWLKHSCSRCALPLDSQKQLLCAQCIQSEPSFDKVEAAFSYEFPINQVIPHCKQLKGVEQIHWLADSLLSQLLSSPREWPEVLIPVPSHWLRYSLRGFNPPSLISQYLSPQLDITTCDTQLKKVRATSHQAGLSAKERNLNLRQAFQYTGQAYNHVALIEDVVTTGTTIEEISQLLKSCGVMRVDVWALARTPKPPL